MLSTLFPDAKQIEHGGAVHLVIPHGPRESVLLKKAGKQVPPPVLSYYDWAGGTPFEVQKQTVALMTTSPRAYILNDMGTGKSRAALWAWDYLRKHDCAGKLLIVAPLSTLRFNWLREVTATIPHRKAVVLHHVSKTKRRELLDDPEAEIFIINHDGVKTIEEELNARTDISTLVLDELAVYRNNSIRSKRMRKFAERFDFAWGMSGRPMPNHPTDVWSQCKIITPGSVPKYFKQARDALMYQITQFKWAPKDGAVETAFSWMQPSVRFKLDDVVELPEFISRTIDVEMSDQQLTIYRKMVNELAAAVQNKLVTAANAGVLMGKLLQVAAGYVYHGEHGQSVALESDGRKQALLEIIQSAEHKIIVFAPWRHLIAGLDEILSKEGIDHAIIHGDTKDREEIFSLFQSTEKYRVLLAHPGCISHGLTLTAADTVVWYAPISSLETYEQANGRIRRYGQKHKQQFLHLQGTAVERKLYRLLQDKQNLQDRLLAMFEEATTGDING
jgi:SNF2 family DNA or RNA helicase